jgi:Tfp pilus assembly protein PilW
MNKIGTLGYSLVELMIAMAIGLVVIGSVLAFTLSSLETNTEYVQATRLTQELRNTMDLAIRDVKRAGYNQNAMKYVSLPANSTARSPFAPVSVTTDSSGNGCIIYAYDSSAPSTSSTSGPGFIDTANGEIKGLRHASRTVDGLTVGVVEIAQTSSAVSSINCGGGEPDYENYPATCSPDGWCALSDPKQVDISAFTITKAQLVVDPTGSTFGSAVRRFDFVLTGRLPSQNTISRSVQSTVLVRADCLYLTTGQCDSVPSP